MTDTRFAIGESTAYVTDRVMALTDASDLDSHVMELCVLADWGRLDAAVAEGHIVAAVEHDGARVRVAVGDAAMVHVVTSAGEQSFGGTGDVTKAVVEGTHHVTITSTSGSAAAGPMYRIDGGVVPASTVSRRIGAPMVAPVDPFDLLFGHTVVRSVEGAAVRETGAPRRLPPSCVLVFTSGQRVLADADLVIGRNPRRGGEPEVVQPGETPPRVVTVSHPGVSRRHAAVRIDRWGVTIEDLGSANGTTVEEPGRSPIDAIPGEPVGLGLGAVVGLGGDVSFSVEATA